MRLLNLFLRRIILLALLWLAITNMNAQSVVMWDWHTAGIDCEDILEACYETEPAGCATPLYTDSYFRGSEPTGLGVQACAENGMVTVGWPEEPILDHYILFTASVWPQGRIETFELIYRSDLPWLRIDYGNMPGVPSLLSGDVELNTIGDHTLIIPINDCVMPPNANWTYGMGMLMLRAYGGPGEFILREVKCTASPCGSTGMTEYTIAPTRVGKGGTDLIGRKVSTR